MCAPNLMYKVKGRSLGVGVASINHAWLRALYEPELII